MSFSSHRDLLLGDVLGDDHDAPGLLTITLWISLKSSSLMRGRLAQHRQIGFFMMASSCSKMIQHCVFIVIFFMVLSGCVPYCGSLVITDDEWLSMEIPSSVIEYGWEIPELSM